MNSYIPAKYNASTKYPLLTNVKKQSKIIQDFVILFPLLFQISLIFLSSDGPHSYSYVPDHTISQKQHLTGE